MADFVAVLKTTIDGLSENTPAMREKVYQKARSTVAAKLAAISPPPPAAVSHRQQRALEEAIEAVKSSYAGVNEDPFADLENVIADPVRKAVNPVVPPAVSLDEELLAQPSASNAPSNKVTPISSRLKVEEENTRSPSPIQPIRLQKPPEPAVTEGPNFQVRGGKLAGALSPPGNAEIEVQKRIHTQLKAMASDALPLLVNVKNRFPELVNAVIQYSSLLEEDTASLDVVALWSTGGAIQGFADAYSRQNIDRTISEPMEPQIEGLMQNITRLHGALIMGFEEGRDLVNKADEFLLDTKTLAAIEKPGNELLDIFAHDQKLIDARTLRINKPVSDYVHEFGWSTSRTGFAAYVTVRNGIYALIRFSIGTDVNLTTVTSAAYLASAIAGDPNAVFLKAALPLLQQQATNMLAFVNHSPEFRAYVEWALSVIWADQNPPES